MHTQTQIPTLLIITEILLSAIQVHKFKEFAACLILSDGLKCFFAWIFYHKIYKNVLFQLSYKKQCFVCRRCIILLSKLNGCADEYEGKFRVVFTQTLTSVMKRAR